MNMKKKYFAIIPVFLLSLYFPITSHAVYPVHDSRVYQQILIQVKKVTEQIKTIREQIDLQKQHLYDISWGKIQPEWETYEKSRKEFETLRSSMSGIFSEVQDVEKAFKDTFSDWSIIDVKQESYGSLRARMNQDRSQVAQLDRETVILINHKQKEIEESNKRVKKYSEMLKDTHGDKDLGQLKALIAAETVYSQNLASDINMLRTKLDVVRNEVKKQEKEAEQVMSEKVGNDFENAASELESLSNNARKSNSYDSTYDEMAASRGWF